MNRNESDWRGMNFNPKLLPALPLINVYSLLSSIDKASQLIIKQVSRKGIDIFSFHFDKLIGKKLHVQ